jgi:hypothetical protein
LKIFGENTYKPNSQWPEPVRASPSARPNRRPIRYIDHNHNTSLRRLPTENRKSSQISTAILQPLECVMSRSAPLFSCYVREMPLIVMGPFTCRAYHINVIVQVARRGAHFETAHEEGLPRLGPSLSSHSLMSRAMLVLGRPLRNREAHTPHFYQNPDLRL